MLSLLLNVGPHLPERRLPYCEFDPQVAAHDRLKKQGRWLIIAGHYREAYELFYNAETDLENEPHRRSGHYSEMDYVTRGQWYGAQDSAKAGEWEDAAHAAEDYYRTASSVFKVESCRLMFTGY